MASRRAARIDPNEIEQLYTGIDWITFMTSGFQDSKEVDAIADEAKERDLAEGSALKAFSFQGYHGWRTASVARGYTPEGSVLMSSSGAADAIAIQLAKCTGRVTRLDVQATCRLSIPRLDLDGRATSLLKSRRASSTQAPSLRGRSWRSDGLRIGTVGKRTRHRYLRVYDKGTESRSDDAGRLWRLELEAKRGLADRLWSEYRETPDVRSWCYGSLEAQWKASGSFWPLPKSSERRCALGAGKRKEAPVAALLRWYQSSVAPTLPRAIRAAGIEEVIEALGLTGVVVPAPRSSDDE